MSPLRKVFGIYSISPVLKIDKTIEAVRDIAVKFAQGYAHGDTFKIDVKRSDKTFRLIHINCKRTRWNRIKRN